MTNSIIDKNLIFRNNSLDVVIRPHDNDDDQNTLHLHWQSVYNNARACTRRQRNGQTYQQHQIREKTTILPVIVWILCAQ